MCASMVSLHLETHSVSISLAGLGQMNHDDATYLGPNLLIAQITLPLARAITPTPVNSQPSPMEVINGLATTAPTQEKMLRTKLFAATPEEALRGINSVSIVVAMAKISMEPTPKKKLAINYEAY